MPTPQPQPDGLRVLRCGGHAQAVGLRLRDDSLGVCATTRRPTSGPRILPRLHVGPIRAAAAAGEVRISKPGYDGRFCGGVAPKAGVSMFRERRAQTRSKDARSLRITLH